MIVEKTGEQYSYKTNRTCSSRIDFEIKGNKIYNVRFTNGCAGNTSGLARLVEGMDADEVVKKLEGIDCGGRGTSCPDQLAKAIKEQREEKFVMLKEAQGGV